MPPPESTAPRPTAATAVAIVLVLGAALALRAGIVGDGFWLDEIWSWSQLYGNPERTRSFVDLFTHQDLRLDNNHLLVTVWMFLVGDLDRWVVYRLPCLAAGLVTVWFAVDRDQGVRGVLVGGGVFAGSVFLALYSTEARGYALAGCFALAAYRILARREGEDFALTRSEHLVLPLVVLLAACSHLVALHFYLGALLWTGVHLWRRLGPAAGLRRFAVVHGASLVLLLGLWLVFVRGMSIGGGAGLPPGWILQGLCAWLTGAPDSAVAFVAAALLLGLAAAEVRHRARSGSSQWILLLTTAVLAPVGVLSVTGTLGILYARYFFVAGLFVLLFASRALVRLGAGRGRLAPAALAITLLFLTGNAVRYVAFVTGGGRGQYLEAVQRMSSRSPPRFVVGADDDFRNGMVLGYYRRFLPPGQQIGFLRDAERHRVGPDWFLIHRVWSPRVHDRPLPRIRLPSGVGYELVGSFPHHGPSGFTWHLYARL